MEARPCLLPGWWCWWCFFYFFYLFGALDSDWIGEWTAGHVTPESRGLILQKAFVVITNPPAPSLPVQSSLKRLSRSFPSSCFFLTQPHGHHADFSSKAHPSPFESPTGGRGGSHVRTCAVSAASIHSCFASSPVPHFSSPALRRAASKPL